MAQDIFTIYYQGVTVALASVESQQPNIDISKKTVLVTYIQRLILNHSKNINEAVSIIKKYNITNPVISLYQHWLIGDSSGKSVIVECNDGELKIIPNIEAWQIATNTLVYPYYKFYKALNTNDVNEVPCSRYQVAYETLKNTKGSLTWEKGMQILKSVSQTNTLYPMVTQYSMVYDMKTRDAYLSIYGKYNKIFKFDVKPKILNTH